MPLVGHLRRRTQRQRTMGRRRYRPLDGRRTQFRRITLSKNVRRIGTANEFRRLNRTRRYNRLKTAHMRRLERSRRAQIRYLHAQHIARKRHQLNQRNYAARKQRKGVTPYRSPIPIGNSHEQVHEPNMRAPANDTQTKVEDKHKKSTRFNGQEFGIYVCHHRPLCHRKTIMTRQAGAHGLSQLIRFIEAFPPEDIKGTVLRLFNPKRVSKTEMSLFLKHIVALRSILNAGEAWGIVMEDDCLFHPDFVDKLEDTIGHIPHTTIDDQKATDLLPHDWDIIYIGCCQFSKQTNGRPSVLPANIQPLGKELYEVTGRVIDRHQKNNKGSDAYIISANCCKKILSALEHYLGEGQSVYQPIDHFLGNCGISGRLKTWWHGSAIIDHGSQSYYPSSIRSR